MKKRFLKYGKIVNEFTEKLIRLYLDTLGSIRDILLQKKQSFFLNQFNNNISKQAYTNVKNSFFMEIPRLFIELFIVISISLIIFFLFSQNQETEKIQIMLFILFLLLILFCSFKIYLIHVTYHFNFFSWTETKLIIKI